MLFWNYKINVKTKKINYKTNNIQMNISLL